MNKTELVADIADRAKLTKKDSEAALNAFVSAVETALQKGDKVSLVGFGTFEVRIRSAREGINPATKKSIKIPEKKVPAFKAGKGLKDLVNTK